MLEGNFYRNKITLNNVLNIKNIYQKTIFKKKLIVIKNLKKRRIDIGK